MFSTFASAKWLAAGGLFIIVVGFAYFKGGEAARKDLALYKAEIAYKEAQRTAKQSKITENVTIQYVNRTQVVKEKSDAITNQASSVTGVCPGSVGVFHDAAALQVPPAPRGADEGTTDAKALTKTITQNYGSCHQVREQLRSLQQWIRDNALLDKK